MGTATMLPCPTEQRLAVSQNGLIARDYASGISRRAPICEDGSVGDLKRVSAANRRKYDAQKLRRRPWTRQKRTSRSTPLTAGKKRRTHASAGNLQTVSLRSFGVVNLSKDGPNPGLADVLKATLR